MTRTHFTPENHAFESASFESFGARHHHDGQGGEHFGEHRRGGFGPRGGAGFGGFGADFGSQFAAGFGPGFGPRGARRAGKGDIRSVILSLLAEEPSNGYGLIKAIAERTGGAWRPSPGSVYPTLQQLVDEDLIVSNGEGRKTEFELTDAGRIYVAEHEEEFAKAWDATPGRSETAVELVKSVGKFMGVVGQFSHSATDDQRKAAMEKIDEARRALYLILAD
jgi:DNA-binding PadR family transcriptional regulator